MSVLSVRDLNVSVRDQLLVKGVSFDIDRGEIAALVGESGSGKSLTALSIMGLLPTALRKTGEVTPDYSAARGLEAGMIFQEPMTSLNPLHTLGKQIGESINIYQHGLSPSQVRGKVQELLDKVGLGHFKERLDAYPHQLSGGERQRVMIAMAIANNPKLLIADEPTTALDVTIQAQILALIEELRKSLGMAVLLITHDLPLVRRIADKVAIMSKGELVEQGRTADIFTQPKHPYTRRLLASEPGEAAALPLRKTDPLMECAGLAVSYAKGGGLFAKKERHTVLSGITLSVPEGTTLGVVGESGSGKTSLAFALLKLIPSEGEIRFSGSAIGQLAGKALRQKRRDMQVVFQDPFSSLNPRMPVGDLIREGLDVHEPRMPETEKQSRLDAILEEVGLTPEMKQRYPHEFSGGQRQRISIARALILKPRLVILDEPTSALDLSVQAQILEMLKSLQEKHGITYIFISHDLRVVRAVSHHIIVLEKGRMIETGPAREIFEHPKEAYTQALLKAAML